MTLLTSQSIFSVDVEDWFHILEVPGASGQAKWQTYPSRVRANFLSLLDLFDEHHVQATCFFLGWIAEKHPDLVREADRRGHEIASHGYAHRLAWEMGPEPFFEDVSRSKRILEDILGHAVGGHRAAGFSLTDKTPWFFDKLAQVGFRYDSSVFPAQRQHGGIRTSRWGPYKIRTEYGEIVEFPVSVASVMGRPVCFFGGGYLRLFPYVLVRSMGRRVLAEGRPLVFYVHPREIDPGHPRLEMSAIRRFKSYVGLRTTRRKVRRLLGDFAPISFANYLSTHTLDGASE